MKLLAVIKHLVKHGRRGDEWQEAETLHKIEEVIRLDESGEKVVWSAVEVQRLAEQRYDV